MISRSPRRDCSLVLSAALAIGAGQHAADYIACRDRQAELRADRPVCVTFYGKVLPAS